MRTTTVKQQLVDLNRLRQNTETFLYGFLNFTTSQKPPFPNSWLGFDIDKGNYVFMVIKPSMEYQKGDKLIFYPDYTNRILITPDTEWLYTIFNEVNYGKHRNDKQEYLKEVAAKVQPVIMAILNRELEALKQKITITLTVEEKSKKLF